MSLPTDSWVSNPGETRGPLISVSCWALVGVSAVFLSLRLHIRQRSSKLWLDDILLVIAWLFLLGEVITTQLSINLGFGKHALDINLMYMERIAYQGAIGLSFSTVAINISKISFGVTLLRLTTSYAKYYTWFAIGTIILFSIPAIIMPWIQCKPLVKTFVDFYPGECIDKRPTIRFGEFQSIWAALMDFSLAMIPWAILWNVQMRLTEKVGVGIAMSLGILAGAASIMRGIYLKQLIKQDISYDAANSLIWTAAESAITIIATSIPVLRAFMRDKVDSAIKYYNNSTGRTGNSSNAQSQGWSGNQPSKKGASINNSRNSHMVRGSKQWINLTDMSDSADASMSKSVTHESQKSLDDSRQKC